MKARDIYLADFKETASDDEKLRPVLIVSSDQFNRGDDVTILPISHSADPASKYVFELDATSPDFRLTGLKKIPSSVKWTKPFTLPKRLLKVRLGSVTLATFDAIRGLLRGVFAYPDGSSSK